MKWLARLKNIEIAPEVGPTKPTKQGSVGSVGAIPGHIQKIVGDFPAANDSALDADRWCWPHSTAMTGIEIDTFTARLSRFTDKGLMLDRGEALVDKLVVRDREQDDRHLCLECLHLAGYGTGSWRCGNWLIAGAAPCAIDVKLSTDLLEQLQRCDGFALHQAAQSHIEIGGAKSE